MSVYRRFLDPIKSRWHLKKLKQSQISITPLSIYLRLDDVYSYLAIQFLDEIEQILVSDIKPLNIIISQNAVTPPNAMSQQDWQDYCLQDAKILADQHGFSFNNTPKVPTQEALDKAYFILQRTPLEGKEFLYLLEDIFHMLWQQQEGKLDVLYQLHQTLIATDSSAFQKSTQPILTAYFTFAHREYHAIDGLLRLTRRLRQAKLLTVPPIFLINHIEWGEHLIQGVEEIADIQALQPELDLYIAFEDPMSWLILAYIKGQLLDYYNIKLKIYPLEFQGKDAFDWDVAYRLSYRTKVDFSPFCRPTETATLQMAKLFYSVPEEQQVSALYYMLQAVWTQAKDFSYPKHWKQMQEMLNIQQLQPQNIYQRLQQNTQQCQALKQPNLPVLKLRIAGDEYVFNSLYRIWLIESIFSTVLEKQYKNQRD